MIGYNAVYGGVRRWQAGVVLTTWFVLVSFASGCEWGTLSEEELRAEYQVEWEYPPTQLAEEFAAELADEMDAPEVEFKKLNLHPMNCSTDVREPGSEKVWSYWYDGFWLSEVGLTSARDKDPEETLFTISDVPLDKLDKMIEEGRETAEFRPASLDHIGIERDDEPPWTLQIRINYGTVGENHSVLFNGEGENISP